MRILAAVFMLVVMSGCVSEETRDLAWGISQYQASQAKQVKELVAIGVEAGKVTEDQAKGVNEDAEALVRASNHLVEILGEPKTKPDLGIGGE